MMKKDNGTKYPPKPAPRCSAVISSKMPCCAAEAPAKQKGAKTCITAHIDCGFSNNLFLRGEGVSSLSWEKGVQMKNVGPSEWVWESDRPFSIMRFKVLINDKCYEQGDNHSVAFGKHIDITPKF
jgi:hypothetical protein